jgi:hypothetical protein
MTGVQGPAGVTGAPGAPASPAMLSYRWSSLKEFMFDYDRSDIRYSESKKPGEVAAYMSQNPSVRLGIVGYMDMQGTNQYNQPLNQRRVATVRDAGTFGTDRFQCNPVVEQCSQREGRVEVLVRASN